MRIPILTFGAIASIIAINSVFADTIVTSRQYVDTTRQATIPAAGTNASTPGTTVVTYTGTAGQIGERGIFNPATDFNFQNNTIAPGHEGDLLDAGSIFPNLVQMDDMVQQIQLNMPDFDDLPTKTVTHRTCTRWIDGQSHTDANCLLWNLVDETVYGAQCNVDADCAGYIGNCSCVNHMCDCVIISQ